MHPPVFSGASHTRRWVGVIAVFAVGVLPLSAQQAPSMNPNVVQLAPCPDSPNCVSTEATDEVHRVDTVPFSDDAATAFARAKAALLAEPRSKVISEQGHHLRGECRSFVFRFVDDVDIVVDSAARVFRFRSASRVGRSDLGVNRKRIARIAERLRK